MAFAIWIKTESSDNYVYALDGQPSKIEILDFLEERLGDEIDYIADFETDATYPINFSFIRNKKDK